MAEVFTIRCQDCAHPIQTKRANTKFCSVCRLLRDLPYVAQHGDRKCGLCDAYFAPLDVRDRLCAKHTPVSERHGITTCVYCRSEKPRARAEIEVCDQCIRDPELRTKLYRALDRKQQHRRDEARAAPAGVAA